jgi:hypothetical protein
MGSRDLLIRPEVLAAKSARLREELHRLADRPKCERPFGPINDVAEQLQAPPRTEMAHGSRRIDTFLSTQSTRNMALNCGQCWRRA